MNAEIQRKRAAQTVAMLLDRKLLMMKLEREAFEDYVKEQGDYPPRTFGFSHRIDMQRVQDEIDDTIDRVIGLRDRGNFIERVALAPWEAFKERAKFMVEVAELSAP